VTEELFEFRKAVVVTRRHHRSLSQRLNV
jgi:hypothetical protein